MSARAPWGRAAVQKGRGARRGRKHPLTALPCAQAKQVQSQDCWSPCETVTALPLWREEKQTVGACWFLAVHKGPYLWVQRAASFFTTSPGVIRFWKMSEGHSQHYWPPLWIILVLQGAVRLLFGDLSSGSLSLSRLLSIMVDLIHQFGMLLI